MTRMRNGKRILAFTAAALLMGATAMAQQQSETLGMAGQQSGQSPMPGDTANPEYHQGGVPGAQMSMSRSFADTVFLRRALAHSAAETQMSLLAEQKSPSADVKQFGERMVLIHNHLNEQLEPIALRLGVSMKQKLGKKQKHKIAELQSLSGPAFDSAYLQTMARYLHHDVHHFRTEADAAQDAEIRQLSGREASRFARQLEELEILAQNHNVTLGQMPHSRGSETR